MLQSEALGDRLAKRAKVFEEQSEAAPEAKRREVTQVASGSVDGVAEDAVGSETSSEKIQQIS